MAWRIAEFFSGREKMREFEKVLSLNGYSAGIKEFFRIAAIEGAAVFLIALAVLLYMGASDLYITVVPALASALPLGAHYFHQVYKAERRKKAIERLVPDMLLQASMFPKGTPMTETMGYIANAKYGVLSDEFARALGETRKGASIEDALISMAKRNNSAVLDRALNLLAQGYASGADMSETFREAAEDMLETNSILRERTSSMVIEKYTLLFAGGLVVPLVLGLIVGLVKGLDFSMLADLEIGMGAAGRSALLEAALLANMLYISEYAVLASLFVANQENDIKKSVIYAAVLVPLSIATYTLAQVLWEGGAF